MKRERRKCREKTRATRCNLERERREYVQSFQTRTTLFHPRAEKFGIASESRGVERGRAVLNFRDTRQLGRVIRPNLSPLILSIYPKPRAPASPDVDDGGRRFGTIISFDTFLHFTRLAFTSKSTMTMTNDVLQRLYRRNTRCRLVPNRLSLANSLDDSARCYKIYTPQKIARAPCTFIDAAAAIAADSLVEGDD